MSKGKIEVTSFDEITVGDTPDLLDIIWTTETTGYQLASDIPYVVIMSTDFKILKAYNGEDLSATRANGVITVPNFQYEGSYSRYVYLTFNQTNVELKYYL